MKQLKYINLNNSNIHDCNFMSNLVHLEKLKLFDVIEYYDTFYEILKTLTNLTELSISIPYTYKEIWNFSDNIVYCNKLKKLDMKLLNVESNQYCNNNIEYIPILISIFNNLKSIESLNLSENMISMKEFEMLIEKVGVMGDLDYLNVYVAENNTNEIQDSNSLFKNVKMLNNLKMLIIKSKNENFKYLNKMRMFLDIILY